MSDIFAVQEEIARTVVAQLKLTLLGPAPRSIATDPEAYALVLKGKHLAAQYSADDLGQAVAAFEQALRIDPTYPMAWVELSWAYVSQLRIGTLPVEQGTRLARVAAEKALALAPDLPLVYERLAYIARVIENDPAAQARYYRQGLELDPQNLELLRGAVFYLVSASRCDEAMNVAHHVIANNPYDPRIHVGLGIALYCVGRQEEAVAKFRHARELSPNYFGIRYQIGLSLLLNHDAAGALEEFRHEPFKAHRLTGNALAFHTLGRKREFEDTMIELEEESSRRPIAIRVAMARAWSGNSNAAFASLEQAAKQHQLELWSLAGSRVFAITLGNDPRWLPFLRTIGQAPEQLAAIKFDVKLPQQ